jgi:hypothetical protein
MLMGSRRATNAFGSKKRLGCARCYPQRHPEAPESIVCVRHVRLSLLATTGGLYQARQ